MENNGNSPDEFFEKLGSQTYLNVQRKRSLDKELAEISGFPMQGMGSLGELRRWSAADDIFWGANEIHDKLPAGMYTSVVVPNIGNALKRSRIQTDALLVLPDSHCTEIIHEFHRFWELGDSFKQRGFLH